MSDELPREIRCVLVPAGNLRLLLPNATVAEVITQPAHETIEDSPVWLIGTIPWRGRQVPLVSFARMVGAGEGDPELVVRVAVLRALGGHPELPFVAVLTQGFPRLATLNAELVIATRDGKPLPRGVRARVLVRDDVAVIPDLEAVEEDLLQYLNPDPAFSIDSLL